MMCTELTFEKDDIYNYMDILNGVFSMKKASDKIYEEVGISPIAYSEDIENVVFIFKENLSNEKIILIEEIMRDWDMSLI